MWFSVALAILGAIFDNLSYIQPFLDPKTYGIGLMVIAICIAILRVTTTSSLDEK
jgi:hypothetical protein